MRVFIVVTLLAILAASSIAENPGFIAGLKIPIVNKIKAQFFPPLMEQFSQISINDMKIKDLQITGISVEIENDTHENVQMSFNQEKNALAVTVTETRIRVHVNWRYKLLVVKFSGVGDIKGTISHVGMNLGFETQEKEGKLIPKINIQDFDLAFDKKSFKFHFDCKGCSGKINDLIINAFKGQLLDKIKSEARKVVNNKVVDKVNIAIYAKYPLSVALNNQLSMSLANTGAVVVKEGYLRGPIDGTIFLTKEGYNRPFEALEIPVEDSENPGEILFFISKYIYQTLQRSLNKTPVTFDTTLMGFAVNIRIDGETNPIEIDTRDDAFHMLGGAVVSIPALRIAFEVGASADIDMHFSPGDSDNVLFIDPEVDRESLHLNKFRFSLFGFSINLSSFTGIANYIISFIISKVVFPVIAIPKSKSLPLTATAAIVSFFDEYTEAGIAFNFGLDH